MHVCEFSVIVLQVQAVNCRRIREVAQFWCCKHDLLTMKFFVCAFRAFREMQSCNRRT